MDTPEKPKTEPSSDDILNELRDLGQNLKELLQAAWESEERKKAQKEIETGLNDLAKTLSQTANDFAQSPTGQTLKADVEDLRDRLRSGEVESKVRDEVLTALRTANAGLKKATAGKQQSPVDEQQ